MKTGNLAVPAGIATGAPRPGVATAPYRGRLAPSPTGFLHRGHAATFWRAQERARSRGGALVLRIEDLDRVRCRPEFDRALLADLCGAGLDWNEGPDCGGPYGPYRQSERREFYLAAWRQLAAAGSIYPCLCTRRDVARAASAPHAGESGAIYPGCCRPPRQPAAASQPDGVNWRLRTEPEQEVTFVDGCAGPQSFVAGRDFGDFIIWRRDGVPAYQLAVVVDDAAMRVTEVVRGEDLLLSTAQQLLLYRALELAAPEFYHVPLVTDENGVRLAKRAGAHSLRAWRKAS
jgi:glutamyl-tRNA synthetase